MTTDDDKYFRCHTCRSLIKRWQVKKDSLVGRFVQLEGNLSQITHERTQQKIEFLNAVRSCQTLVIEKVLKNPGIDVNLRIHSGMTPLMHAAGKGNAECVSVLLKSGADVNLTDFSYKTALGHAVQGKSFNCIALLLGANIDFGVETRLGKTSLFDVVAFGNETFVKLVCESGADVNKRNNIGNTPAMFAAIYGHVEIMKCLVSFEAVVNDVNKTSGQTPLMMALKRKNLLRLGKDAEKQYYRKPKRHSAFVQVLLELGADVNMKMKDQCDRTALFIAAFHGCVESLTLLLRANADIKTCDMSEVNLSLLRKLVLPRHEPRLPENSVCCRKRRGYTVHRLLLQTTRGRSSLFTTHVQTNH